jgi:hypothetical protein
LPLADRRALVLEVLDVEAIAVHRERKAAVLPAGAAGRGAAARLEVRAEATVVAGSKATT